MFWPVSQGSHPGPCPPLMSSLDGRSPPVERRRVSMASERQRRTADSLTLPCPGLSALGLSDQTGQYRLLSGLQLASEPIRNRTCHRGTKRGLTPPTSSAPPPSWASEGAARGQGQRLGWPLLSRHVWTRPHTKQGPGRMIRIWGRRKRARGLRTVAVFLCLHVCCWHGDLARDRRTTGPPQKGPPSPRCACSPCLRSLCWLGRREELHQGWSRITGSACLSGRAYFCWLGLVFSSSQCCHHGADPFDVLIPWPAHYVLTHASRRLPGKSVNQRMKNLHLRDVWFQYNRPAVTDIIHSIW